MIHPTPSTLGLPPVSFSGLLELLRAFKVEPHFDLVETSRTGIRDAGGKGDERGTFGMREDITKCIEVKPFSGC